jgi:DnaJ-class molecular chaperone
MTAFASDDYYALLGIDAGADGVALRRAWRRLALRWHPDRAGPLATATFQKIQTAYNVLSDPAARAAYDRRRAPPRAPASAEPGGRRSAPGVLLPRHSGPLQALIACGLARHAEPGVIELVFNAREAAQGGMAAIPMRVLVHCTACAGEKKTSCARCGGKGTTDELFSAWLAVPPDVADGTILVPSAFLDGMVQPVSFRVRLRGVE